MLVPSNESKEKIKKYRELRSKIGDLVRLITKNPDDYDEKYIKPKFSSNHKLPLNKMIEIYSVIMVVRTFLMTNIVDKFS